MLDEASTFETPTYPPYNIERMGEDEYLISLAIAGFSSDDVNIEVKGNDLTITGKKTDKPEGKKEYLHQGIAGRNFQQTFQLADNVEVKGAELNEGPPSNLASAGGAGGNEAAYDRHRLWQ